MPGVLDALLAALLQLTIGTLFAALLSDWRGGVTPGFLVLTALIALVVGVLGVAVSGLARVDGLEPVAHVGLVAGLFVYVALLVSGRRLLRLRCGIVALAVGFVALALAALSRPSSAIGPFLTGGAFVASALALGTATAGLLLGHWYLVTPGLSSRPLRRLCDILLLSLVPLTTLAGWYLLDSGGSAGSIGAGGLSGAPLWLGAGMITVFPLLVTVGARACCVDGPRRGRSLQAATGLLYLVAAAVLAGGLAGNAVLLGLGAA